jgi:hypothetical protein
MQFIPLIIVAVIVLVLLALPRAAKTATSTSPPPTIVPAGANLTRAWPSKYKGGWLVLKIVEPKISQVTAPALDAASKDAAKMTLNITPNTYDWIKDKWRCSDVLVRVSLPGEIVAQNHPMLTGNECVDSMKVPAGPPLTVHMDFSNAGGWIESVEGGHATADVVTEKVGPDHIVHKHIAGVKYEDITVAVGGTQSLTLLVHSYAPQLPPPVQASPK